ncbi:hypothetical protein CRV01_03275 [Arcobacter sp. CECT 8983]|uniref:hypothetical protein n=1 Tax=Arcobacter sp. CECT 8983 TaxID=2044508 RepID=UPI00100AB2AE|nr:hypothetical protein [Arcobacter sp. CECT 8983]RXJ90197.1 hypothetical protein CRV01_03275 [Arcobacter sp. CECT 8983]
MSMSQEEIEALMNGLDFEDDSSKEESTPAEQPEISKEVEPEPQAEETTENSTMSEDDINDLIAQTEEIVNNKEEDTEEETVDDILNNIEETEPVVDTTQNIDDVLKEVESIEEVNEPEVTEDSIPSVDIPTIDETDIPSVEEPTKEESTDESISEEQAFEEDNFDDILSSIDGIQEEEPKEETTSESEKVDIPYDIPANDPDIEDIDSKINSGVFPLPVEQDNKVVNQLSQVANDSEEKATKIFDVLSNILDYNNEIQNDVQELANFSDKQTAMLSSLNQKFPNIDAFKQNLEQAEKMGNFISDINDKINNGNMEIFQAMELMQYHDINRQKIERVMSVIRKLTVYLNNLFEDENDYKEIAVAKHIHGDSSTGDLMAEDDLDALIAEFNK